MNEQPPAPDDSGETRPSAEGAPRRPPPQFSLGGLFLLTAATALLFGVLRWLGVPPEASGFILVTLIVAGIAAIGLLVAIMRE